MRPKLYALCLAFLAATGCWDLLPASNDPIGDATHREPRVCPATAPVYPPELFSPRSVISVAPLYYLRDEHGNRISHLWGATLVLRAIPGLSSQELERLLSCHSARSLLKRPDEPVVPNNPYWAPGHVVRVTVEFEEGATTVRIEGKDFEGAKAILERAQAFVQRAQEAT